MVLFHNRCLLLFCLIWIIVSPHPLVAQQVSPMTPLGHLEDLLLISGDQETQYFRRNDHTLVVKHKQLEMEILKPSSTAINFVNYQVRSSWFGKKVAIFAEENPFIKFSNYHDGKIYIGDLGSKELIEVGQGVNPQLHGQDQWLSYYVPKTSQLILKSLNLLSENEKIIKLNALPLQGHLPQVALFDQQHLLYTDQNAQGHMSLVYYDLFKKSFTFLYQGTNSNQLGFCVQGQNIFLRESHQTATLLYLLHWKTGQLLPQKQLIDQMESLAGTLVNHQVLGPICTEHPQLPVLMYSHQQLHRYSSNGNVMGRKKLEQYSGLWTNHQVIYMEKEGRYDLVKP